VGKKKKKKGRRKTGKGLGTRNVVEKRRNGKEREKNGARGEKKKADATKSIFIGKVSSNYQCIYSKGHCLKKTIERMHNVFILHA